jgi:ArsR family transcriptional regulator
LCLGNVSLQTMAVNIKRLGAVSKALSDPHRIKILQVVRQETWVQCADIIELMDLSQPAVSHHIKLLVEVGLLKAEKEGRNYKYTLEKDGFKDYIKFLEDLNQ